MTVLTEAEARRQWCPMVRIAHEENGVCVGNRGIREANSDSVGDMFRCIGSKCMAWRWVDHLVVQERGYCGLAGKP